DEDEANAHERAISGEQGFPSTHRVDIARYSPFLSREYPGVPYPGDRPGVSFVELDGAAWILYPVSSQVSGWVVDLGADRTVELDTWFSAQGAPICEARLPVLAYGSNASPGKIEWLRSTL